MNPPYYTYPIHPSFAPPHNPYHTFTAAHATSTVNQLQPPSVSGSTSGYRAPLSDTTTSTVNNVAPANDSRQNTSKKRKRNNPASGTAKKPRSTSTSLVRPAIPGVGPQTAAVDAPAMIHPALPPRRRDPVNFESLLPKSTNAPGYAATDVWYFVRGIEAAEKPLIAPSNEAVSKQQPDCTKYPSLLCRFCGFEGRKVWTNSDGQTATIRRHFIKEHRPIWEEMVIKERLKNWQKIDQDKNIREQESRSSETEPFTLEGLYERLVCWIATDDQSINTLENPEFRQLFLYACRQICDKDLPHRTRLADLISLQFKKEYSCMISEIKNSLGRVAFTSDVWSRQMMESYMAITAHFIAKSVSNILTLETRLVAFRPLRGSHTGVNLANEFLTVLKEIQCISMTTLDNAKNNQAMMRELEGLLQDLNVSFDQNGNRLRCFPHVINIAVKAGLKQLTCLPSDSLDAVEYDTMFYLDVPGGLSGSSQMLVDSEHYADTHDDDKYQEVLDSDVIGKVRHFTNSCRSSGQRREQFHNVRIAGNLAGGWGENGKIIREIGPINDVETRWDSTLNMTDRFFEIYPVIERLISENDDLAHFAFSEIELQVASDIRRFLLVFRRVQQCVSAEKTPTLSIVLPTYEKAITMLKDLRFSPPKLTSAINESITKPEEYLAISRKTKIYVLAMLLNPGYKLKWIDDNWSSDASKLARQSVSDSLLEYDRASRALPNFSREPPTRRTLVRSNTEPTIEMGGDSAFDDLDSLATDLRASTQSVPNITLQDSPVQMSEAEAAQIAEENGKKRVILELADYEKDTTCKVKSKPDKISTTVSGSTQCLASTDVSRTMQACIFIE
ncbi:hypothetical protein D9619_012446 [Psilocybe cf. subviscida]|uniref:BED-type domain-containing protein n=1 Tax=Psilocybe cf. subviscida TaxID=2480587 RepID=A0A8H5AQY1_9AGAR|nr:hypothetical protein D9619_012446 [Psilocybe cf. subviscida]